MRRSKPTNSTDRRTVMVCNDATFALAVLEELEAAGFPSDAMQNRDEEAWAVKSWCRRSEIVKAIRRAGYEWNSRTKHAKPIKPVIAVIKAQITQGTEVTHG